MLVSDEHCSILFFKHIFTFILFFLFFLPLDRKKRRRKRNIGKFVQTVFNKTKKFQTAIKLLAGMHYKKICEFLREIWEKWQQQIILFHEIHNPFFIILFFLWKFFCQICQIHFIELDKRKTKELNFFWKFDLSTLNNLFNRCWKWFHPDSSPHRYSSYSFQHRPNRDHSRTVCHMVQMKILFQFW